MTDGEEYAAEENPFREFVLHGWAPSFYASKTRSHLRDARVPFREITVGHPYYRTAVQPHLGRSIVPVIRTCEGVSELSEPGRAADFTFGGLALPGLAGMNGRCCC